MFREIRVFAGPSRYFRVTLEKQGKAAGVYTKTRALLRSRRVGERSLPLKIPLRGPGPIPRRRPDGRPTASPAPGSVDGTGLQHRWDAESTQKQCRVRTPRLPSRPQQELNGGGISCAAATPRPRGGLRTYVPPDTGRGRRAERRRPAVRSGGLPSRRRPNGSGGPCGGPSGCAGAFAASRHFPVHRERPVLRRETAGTARASRFDASTPARLQGCQNTRRRG